ncbi:MULTISPECIES: tyrosine-protein phosphatase [Chelatococcus]|uniref:Protein tyrosine/serine phosphatase n=1 Tax=Chelatococcus caeni TaxID=1348468 RepID=A0A840C2G4_9HYPH|nr:MULTISPECIES: sulfur transferase domain-containing protein [Chelatococcus]ALA17959.1 protein tyrosine phosphatase [Chelatococcus sp. CO-6]MBB4020051.1 protein tyrosine/serine phosphatase [Chelatococcus caeni]
MINRFRKPEERYRRRMARIARWDRPVADGLDRWRAWVNMVFVDHGIFRLAYLNSHRVTERFWRAAQPAPHQIRAAARAGVRTIVNLRGGREYGSWPLEREACEQLGIRLTDFVVRSRGAPDRATILAAKDFFETLDYPVLVHCKSGADRAGFMAALYLIIHEKRPVAEAMRQLSLRFGHFRFAKTGILDAFFETYRREGEPRGQDFLTWVAESYDPERLEREFKPGFFSDIVVDRIMRRE